VENGSLPRYRSAVGSPLNPVFMAWFLLARIVSKSELVGYPAEISLATAPATCGEAIEVPEIVLVEELDVHQAAVMSSPGA
jgi:hypothetical protein